MRTGSLEHEGVPGARGHGAESTLRLLEHTHARMQEGVRVSEHGASAGVGLPAHELAGALVGDWDALRVRREVRGKGAQASDEAEVTADLAGHMRRCDGDRSPCTSSCTRLYSAGKVWA